MGIATRRAFPIAHTLGISIGFQLACAVARVSPDGASRHVGPHLAASFAAPMPIGLIPRLSTGIL